MNTKHISLEIPEEVSIVSRVLSSATFENYLVGGCVRDLLLSRAPKDYDLTTIASPEEITPLFEHTFYENDYGTVGIVNEEPRLESLRVIEVTPYRSESAYSDFRRPDAVTWAKTLEEDLKRRDFTMNAIAYDIEKKELIDPFNGQDDLEKKLIRTVGDPGVRFSEDALRMIRALRFAAELGFAIEEETLAAILEHKDLLKHISKERIKDELIKIVMSDAPSIALGLATQLGLLEYITPEFLKGVGMEQNQAHAYTVWEHLLRSLDHAAKKKFPLHVRLAALFHDVGKPDTRVWKNDQWTFYGHEVVGAKITKKVLMELAFPKEIVEKVTKLVRWHMFFSDTEQITLSAVRRMVRNVTPELIWDLMDVRACDRIGTGRPKESPYRLRKYHAMIEEVMRNPISVKQLRMNGGEIMTVTGAPAGPHIGFILEILLSEVLEDPTLNEEKHLKTRVLELHSLPKEELARLGKEARAKNELEDEKESEKINQKFGVK
ncbi:MAG: polynucleotide adenylyltransferase [Parcubacteria group bacterium]|nr:polynucleotide adenylyltransferase [Parcubacteria group bacterium]